MSENNDTKTTVVYVPTEAENKILECLENGKKYSSISELCNEAGVVRDVWYNALKKPDFVDSLLEKSKTMLYASFPSIINTIIKMAQRGSFAHQKMILEMLKVYQGMPQSQNNIQNNITFTWKE